MSGISSGPVAITGPAVVLSGRYVRHCTCLEFYFAQCIGRVHVTCFSRLPNLSPLLLLYFSHSLNHYLFISFPLFFQFSVTGAGAGFFLAGGARG